MQTRAKICHENTRRGDVKSRTHRSVNCVLIGSCMRPISSAFVQVTVTRFFLLTKRAAVLRKTPITLSDGWSMERTLGKSSGQFCGKNTAVLLTDGLTDKVGCFKPRLPLSLLPVSSWSEQPFQGQCPLKPEQPRGQRAERREEKVKRDETHTVPLWHGGF